MEQAPKFLRAEKWVQAHFPSLTRRQAQEALSHGLIQHEGAPLKKGDRVAEDAPLDTRQLEAHLATLLTGNPDLAFDVLHEEEAFVVIDKPAGIHGHPLSLLENGTVTHWALARYPELRQSLKHLVQPCLTPHRLDVGTTGVLIVSKSEENFQLWRQRFSRHEVTKSYLAWCWGTPKNPEFEMHVGIGHDPSNASRMLTESATKIRSPILPAQTQVSVLKTQVDKFLCRAITQTGVTHQIRVHLAAAGFPLLGDELYDELFAERSLKPSWPQLRASEIKHTNFCLQSPSERFITSF
ncbi:MAG: RluA family pseudouridine synthase [Bdellovibrionota bacterium]